MNGRSENSTRTLARNSVIYVRR